jgi:hypothetical protein
MHRTENAMREYISCRGFYVLFLFSCDNFLRSLAVPGQGCLVFDGDPSALCWFPQRKRIPSFLYFAHSESFSLVAPSFMASSSRLVQFSDAVSEIGPPLSRENRFARKIMVSPRFAIYFVVCKSLERCSSMCNLTSA